MTTLTIGLSANSRRAEAGRIGEAVDDRGEPEPELDDDADDLRHVAEEDVEHAEQDAEPEREQLLQQEEGQQRDQRRARETAEGEENQDEDEAGDGEVEGGGDEDDGGQDAAREAGLLQQVGVLEEERLAAQQQLGEGVPGENAGAQVEPVGERVVDARQARSHHLREHHRIDEDHRQRGDERPQAAEQRVQVAALELALHHSEQEGAVLPHRLRHLGAGSDQAVLLRRPCCWGRPLSRRRAPAQRDLRRRRSRVNGAPHFAASPFRVARSASTIRRTSSANETERFPAQRLARLRGVADQMVDLGQAAQRGVFATRTLASPARRARKASSVNSRTLCASPVATT